LGEDLQSGTINKDSVVAHRISKCDVAIIGAGIIGCSIAYHLARHRLRVTLLERGDIASGSSGACDGLVFLQSKKPGIHLELAMASRRRFEGLVGSLPMHFEYKATGGMVLIETEGEMAAMEQYVQLQRQSGLDVSLLRAGQVRQAEPHLSGHLLGAARSPLDGQVNPIALTLGFALGAKAAGVEVMTGSAVKGIDLTGGRVSAVQTENARIQTDVVVNAAGAFAPEIGEMVGLKIPIKPRRGQILVTETCRPMIRHCMISAGYIAAKYNPGAARGTGEGISIEQTESGNFLLGSTREFVGYDKRTTPKGMRHIAAQTAGIIPALHRVNVIRAFAGLRPYTPDGLPILGPAAQVPGFIMAAGHEGDGIALSPITGELMAQVIATGKSEFPLEAFRLSRFDAAEKEPEAAHA
jgi:glycine/D-amino acid oxidase-like deaminating enzyme